MLQPGWNSIMPMATVLPPLKRLTVSQHAQSMKQGFTKKRPLKRGLQDNALTVKCNSSAAAP
jgi:hypothetical protein